MAIKSYELDRKALSALLQKHNVSHGRIARRLKISTKTVQRWVNGSVRHIKIDKLNKLADYLSVAPSELIHGDLTDRVVVARTNELVRQFTSVEYLMRARVNGGLREYSKALKEIVLNDLSNYQELIVLKKIGLSFYGVGSLRWAQEYMEKAYAKAEKINQPEELLRGKSWLMVFASLKGDFKKAQSLLVDAEVRLLINGTMMGRSVFYANKAKMLMSWGKLPEAEVASRKAISLALKDKEQTYLWPALVYPYLGFIQLRQKKYSNAKKTFQRSLELANLAGWPYGVAISSLAIEVIAGLSSGRAPISSKVVRKSKKYFQANQISPLDNRYRQLYFAYCVVSEKYEEALQILEERRKSGELSRLFHAYFVMDVLLLTRLHSCKIALSSVDLQKAQDFFKKQKMTEELNTIRWLKQVTSIDRKEFFQNFRFF